MDFDIPYSFEDTLDWVANHMHQKITFCPNSDDLRRKKSCDKSSGIIYGSFLEKGCLRPFVEWTGKVGQKNGVPKGPGKLELKYQQIKEKDSHKFLANDQGCYDLTPGIHSLSASFSKGKINGKGRAVYDYDDGVILGEFKDGSLEGKATVYKKGEHKLQVIAVYVNGMPEGPAFILPEDPPKDGLVYAEFSRGRILEDRVVYLKPEGTKAIKGKFENGTILRNPIEIDIESGAELGCMRFLNLKYKEGKPLNSEVFRLPVWFKGIPKDAGRILVRSGKTVIFNRIAKTGMLPFDREVYHI